MDMIKIKKVLISQTLVFIFGFQSIGCFAPDCVYAKTVLRAPMVFSGHSEEKDRALGLIVVEEIQKLQIKIPGIKSDTINRKIKKEFNESEYNLRERVRIGNGDNFYVRSGSEYFEIAMGQAVKIDQTKFEQGRRILIKIINKAYSKEDLLSEVKKVTAELQEVLQRPPNIRETADAMPCLEASRNRAALLYKLFQVNKLSPYDYGISRFSGKANLVIKKNFAFAGTRIFLPLQLSGKAEISAEKTPISEETKIDIVDRENPKNRLTIEHVIDQDMLRLTYTMPSGQEVSSDIKGIKGKTSVTLALNPVFSDFYDTVFLIPLYQGKERLNAVAEHLRNNQFGTYYIQQERYVSFHGHLDLPSFYNTHPGRVGAYRDRENWARFILLEDIANPGNIIGYEWREDRVVPLEKDSALSADSFISMDGKEMPLYYLNKSNVFREFDQRLDKSAETVIATSNDTRLSEIAMGTGRFSLRVKRDVRIVSFEGQRSDNNISRDDRNRYLIRIIRADDKSEIKIRYKNPDVQGEFIVEGLNWADGSPVVLKGPAGYDENSRGYFNISTIVEMVRQGLLPGIEASDWLIETFDFSEGPGDSNLRNPIRSYKIEEAGPGEKFLSGDILVDPETFMPWENRKAYERDMLHFGVVDVESIPGLRSMPRTDI